MVTGTSTMANTSITFFELHGHILTGVHEIIERKIYDEWKRKQGEHTINSRERNIERYITLR